MWAMIGSEKVRGGGKGRRKTMEIGKNVEQREKEKVEKVEGYTHKAGKLYGAGMNKCRWKMGCFIRIGIGATG